MNSPLLVLFDGDCKFCNGWVQFITARDHQGRFRCEPLASAEGVAVLARHGWDAAHLDSVVVSDGTRAWVRSSAVLTIARHLPWPWPLLAMGYVVPRFLRDALYRAVAKRRHLLPATVCRLPPVSR